MCAFSCHNNNSFAQQTVTSLPSYSPALLPSKRKAAFTLAEVLITLGIIGVVAALTMPSLIANHQKQVYAAQLKKTISTIQQGIEQMKADDGVDNLEDTSVFIKSRRAEEDGAAECQMIKSDIDSDKCQFLIEGFKKYFNVVDVKVPQNYLLTDSHGIVDDITSLGDYYLFLADGAMVRLYIIQSPIRLMGEDANFYANCAFAIDINGTKKPNRDGYDSFTIYVEDTGKFHYDRDLKRIIQNGWKID